MSVTKVISEIRNVANSDIPKGAQVILFGSQARGDAHKDSDWDLLVLLDKDRITPEDYDMYSYPFWELGWKIDEMIHPTIYTKKDWLSKANPVFRANVERDGVVICWTTKKEIVAPKHIAAFLFGSAAFYGVLDASFSIRLQLAHQMLTK